MQPVEQPVVQQVAQRVASCNHRFRYREPAVLPVVFVHERTEKKQIADD